MKKIKPEITKLNRVIKDYKHNDLSQERVLEEKGSKVHPTNPDIEFRVTRSSKFDKPQRPVRNPKFQSNEYNDKNQKRSYPRRGYSPDKE